MYHKPRPRASYRPLVLQRPLQPTSEAFLYRSPHAPLAETCRTCCVSPGRGRHAAR